MDGSALGHDGGVCPCPTLSPESLCCSWPAGVSLSSAAVGPGGDSGSLCSVGVHADDRSLHQPPPFTGDLPKVTQTFQAAEVGLEPAFAVVLPRALSAGQGTPAPISPQSIIQIVIETGARGLPCSARRSLGWHEAADAGPGSR